MTTAGVKAVFLDRDGVINATIFRRGAQRAPDNLDEWVWIEGVHDTLRALSARGYLLVVCTNQPDVVRGWQTREQVDEFHALITRELPVARVYACFHDNSADCACRKPRPGMLLTASEEFGIDLTNSFMVGDRKSDIEAGQNAGCRTIYFRRAHDTESTVDAHFEVTRLSELLDIVR